MTAHGQGGSGPNRGYYYLEEVYDVGDLVGKGGFGMVHVGTNRHTGEKVALKMIPSELYEGNEWAKHLLRNEVGIMSAANKLQHPHLMRFIQAFEDSHKVVMVLELLSDDLLNRIVRRGRCSEKLASRLIRTVVTAVDALHSVHILHRDLKPDNCIFLSPDDGAPLKIADFGLAAFFPSPDTPHLTGHRRVGTPLYLAPEAIQALHYSPASDMWSVGVMLFLLLSGCPPFVGRSHKELFTSILQGNWGFYASAWAEISDNAKDLVKQMLHPDPALRISTRDVLAHPWIRENDKVSGVNLPQTVEGLKHFNARRKFKVAALACYAAVHMQRLVPRFACDTDHLRDILDDHSPAFTPEELQMLHLEFSLAASSASQAAPMAVSSDGTNNNYSSSSRSSTCLDLESFKGIMTRLNFGHLPLDRIFTLFDQDGSGEIDYTELLLGLSKFRLQGEEAIKFCFKIFDEDKNGAITLMELTKVLVQMYRQRGQQAPGFGSMDMAVSTSEAGTEGEGEGEGRPAVIPEQSPKAPPKLSRKMSCLMGYDERFIDMNPEAYEIAESIAELFASMDENGDNQVTLDEFIKGVKLHPELFELFSNAPAVTANGTSTPDAEPGSVPLLRAMSSFPGSGSSVHHDKSWPSFSSISIAPVALTVSGSVPAAEDSVFWGLAMEHEGVLLDHSMPSMHSEPSPKRHKPKVPSPHAPPALLKDDSL